METKEIIKKIKEILCDFIVYEKDDENGGIYVINDKYYINNNTILSLFLTKIKNTNSNYDRRVIRECMITIVDYLNQYDESDINNKNEFMAILESEKSDLYSLIEPDVYTSDLDDFISQVAYSHEYINDAMAEGFVNNFDETLAIANMRYKEDMMTNVICFICDLYDLLEKEE